MQLRPKGIALVVALIMVAVVAGVASLMFSRTVGEIRNSAENATIVQNLMLARGGINVGSSILVGTMRDELQAVVRQQSGTSSWTFGSGSGSAPDPVSVASALQNVAVSVQGRADALLCPGGTWVNLAPSGVQATVTLRLFFTNTACGQTLPQNIKLPVGRFVAGSSRGASGTVVPQTYALPFVMVAESRQGPYARNIVVQGEYQFDVGESSFARYAYWTNRRREGLYFSTGELIDGPTHSNQYLRYSGTPWFGAPVTVSGCESPTLTSCGTTRPGDDFSGTFVPLSAMSPNPSAPCFGSTCPRFSQGVDWQAAFMPLPASSVRQRDAALDRGLYISSALSGLTLYAGDSNGNPLSRNGSSWTPNPAPFQYIRACTNSTSCQLYRYGSDRALYLQNSDGSWPSTPVRANFNGVVFVNGGISALGGPVRSTLSDPNTAPPALASFAQITVANDGNGAHIRVTGDLKYESPPCTGSPTQGSGSTVIPATCNNLEAQNVLGVYSQQGEVTFGSGDFNNLVNLTVQGVFMSGSNRVGVTNFSNTGNGRELRILGGLIGETASGFSSGSSGYARRITYDQRLLQGLAPPAFPTTSVGNVTSTRVLSFGQREQVY